MYTYTHRMCKKSSRILSSPLTALVSSDRFHANIHFLGHENITKTILSKQICVVYFLSAFGDYLENDLQKQPLGEKLSPVYLALKYSKRPI